MTSEILNIVGLLFDVVGFLIVFRFAPEKFLRAQWGGVFAQEAASEEEMGKQRNRQSQRKWLSFFGAALIVIGFVLQIAGEICAMG